MPSGRKQIIQLDLEATLGALAANSASLTTILDPTNESGFKIEKIKAAVTYRGKTADEGPLSWGFEQGLTGAQVKETLEANPTSLLDNEAAERSNRKVYPQGIIPHHAVDPSGDEQKVWDIRDFPKVIPEGDFLSFYVHNHHNSALTTGMAVQLIGLIYGEWMRD